MRTPSVKTIETKLKVSKQIAKQIRGLMDGSLDPESYKSVQKWQAQCYNWPPRRAEMAMCAIDELLETNGVEGVLTDEYIDSYHFNLRHTYCNTGDSYGNTVIHDNLKNRFMVCAWGNLVE